MLNTLLGYIQVLCIASHMQAIPSFSVLHSGMDLGTRPMYVNVVRYTYMYITKCIHVALVISFCW